MKKIIIPIIIVLIGLLAAYKLKPKEVVEETVITVTEEEREMIKETAGETVEEQEEYMENLELSEDNSLETLKKELEETVILEEEFTDLE